MASLRLKIASPTLDETQRLVAGNPTARSPAPGAGQPGGDRGVAHAPRVGELVGAGIHAADTAAVTAGVLFLGVENPVLVPLLAVVWLLLLRLLGAYRRGLGYPLSAELRVIALGGLSGGLLVLQFGPALGIGVENMSAGALLVPVGFLLFGRVVLRVTSATLRRRFALVRRVLLVGDGPDAFELLANIAAWPGLGIEVVGVCADTTSQWVHGLPVLGRSRSSSMVAHDLGLRTVIFAPGSLDPTGYSEIRNQLLDSGLEVILVPNVAQIEQARLSMRQIGGLPVLRLSGCEQRAKLLGKRAFDLVLALVLLVLLTPLFVFVAFLVTLHSPGPAFFRQLRVGKDGTHFELWKFRTMRVDAESMADDLRAAIGGQTGLFKLRDDPRVNRLGKWLRRTSLDELPQLWNVLLGEMSLVGPRPALLHEVAAFDDLTLRRMRVKPGITGLWQVSGRADASFSSYSRMDAFYADNWTLFGDLVILFRTIPAVFSSRGAY